GDSFVRGFASGAFLTLTDSAPSTASGAERPLVFISATHTDVEWRHLLARALDNYRSYIEWWDDSKILPAADWETEINAAINRAHAAVLLLSPDYIESGNAVVELGRLAFLSKTRTPRPNLKLLPVVVRDCEWQQINEIRDIQVWGNGKPLDNLSPDEVN